ncbi:HAMP domain-containing sensor histidine kinase [Acidocella sp. MX-AZ02]|uniref:sensor histidine kinase n=2 Tax=unclassified Acidocella TaxID=2648610 RepID=UPI000346FBC1|nr:HAMP domain-containing sensor histidine kinase [Acidocella sp. MX-AZ02]
MSPALSLRRTALVWVTFLLVGAGLIAAGAAYLYSKSETADFLDGQLRQIALNAGRGPGTANAPPAPDQDAEDRFAVTIWNAQGSMLHQTIPGMFTSPPRQAGFSTARIGGEAWRVYVLRGVDRTVAVAQREIVRDEIASNAAIGAALPAALLIPFSWLLVWLTLHRTLRRLDLLAADLATRGTMATEPLPLHGIPQELTPLITSMNGLIVRLQAALSAQKRFLADAAHTLRTPIAAMQIEIDNLVAGAPLALPRLAALAAGARRSAQLTDRLLRLARLDEPPALPATRFDAARLLLDCVADHAALAARKHIELSATIPPRFLVTGAEDDVRTLFGNLIENAVTYTQAGGTVDISLRRSQAGGCAEVRDNGPGLPEGAQARIFERFFRATPEVAEGTGLGLAIARRIAERHGFGLEVTNRTDAVRGVMATVTMPGSWA